MKFRYGLVGVGQGIRKRDRCGVVPSCAVSALTQHSLSQSARLLRASANCAMNSPVHS